MPAERAPKNRAKKTNEEDSSCAFGDRTRRHVDREPFPGFTHCCVYTNYLTIQRVKTFYTKPQNYVIA